MGTEEYFLVMELKKSNADFFEIRISDLIC
jgi:hypothetical protein